MSYIVDLTNGFGHLHKYSHPIPHAMQCRYSGVYPSVQCTGCGAHKLLPLAGSTNKLQCMHGKVELVFIFWPTN